MELPKSNIFMVFSQRFCCEYTALKPANDLNKLPPGKAIWSLYQASLRPALPWPLLPSLRLLTPAPWLSCRIEERLHHVLTDRLILKSVTSPHIEIITNISSESWENKWRLLMVMSCFKVTAGGSGLNKKQDLNSTRWKQLKQSSHFFSQPGSGIF